MIIKPKDNLWKNDSEEQHSVEERRVLDILKSNFSNWIKEEHPELQEEWWSIEKDVFKKLKKEITKKKLSFHVAELSPIMMIFGEKECKLARSSPEIRNKNMGLSRKEFKTQIKALQNGDDALIEQVYLSHFEKCVQFLMHQFGSPFEDAHEASLNALLEIRKDLMQEKIFYGNLSYYFTARAKVKLYRLNGKQINTFDSLEEVDIQDDETIEQNIYEDELKKLVSEALNKLCKDCKTILKQYYYDEISLKEIAAKMRKSHDAVRQEARRCRNKLRNYLGEKFYDRFSL